MQRSNEKGFDRFPLAKADYVYPANVQESTSWGMTQAGGWLLVYEDEAPLFMHVSNYFVPILFFLLVYWVLFAVWAIVNAYHRERLNVAWVVVFALFNVFGYLLFRYEARRQLRLRHA